MQNNTRIEFSQFGTFSVVMAVLVIAFIVTMIFITGSGASDQATILIFVAVIMGLVLLTFYKLTITVDDTSVSFRLGIGIVRKKYLISDIKSCKPVRNAVWYGIGIRKIPHGWLYNVSGLDAIELEFRNRRSIVRIGTNNPELVSQTITGLIGTDNYGDSGTTSSKGYSGYSFAVMILLFAFALPAFLILTGNHEQVVEITGDSVSIQGMYGLTLRKQDIVSADTLTVLPVIKLRTNGFAFGNRLKGNFTLKDGSRVKLFIRKGIPPYLLIRTKDLTVYINSDNPANTRRLFEELRKGTVNP